ncbi:MAG: uroporphyrinogen-III synthase [Pseudonocardiaceae bacterium]|nr:uroporphyrinogen-III synthase [Pseudonocardiaceae bacterium]
MASTERADSLEGRTIGVTAERRADDLCASLQRRGAQVWHAPTMHTVPLSGDPELREATERVLGEPVHAVAITTGMGMKGWLEAARGWGLDEPLLHRFGEARVYVRGPKAKGAVRGAGLVEHTSAQSETDAEMFEQVLTDGVRGRRVVVQLHGVPLPEHTGELRDAGAEVIDVLPYRWEAPVEPARVHRLLDGVLDGQVDALTFTSAAATAGLLSIARESGRYDGLLDALRTRVLAACVGPVTAAPLTDLDVPVLQPDRWRLGALVKTLTEALS